VAAVAEQYPKQFLSLTGSNSLFQNTALRAARLDQSVAPLVIGSEAHRFHHRRATEQAASAAPASS